MRLAIISDVHANLEALSATLRQISLENVDRIVCLGDIVGYNADPAECIALLRSSDALCVAGNHDRAVAGQITTRGFSDTAARAVVWTRRQLDATALDFLSRLPTELAVEDYLIGVHQALHPVAKCDMIGLENEERRRLSFRAMAAHPSGANICAIGHTHQLGIYELRENRLGTRDETEVALRSDAMYLINPGTIGQPRSSERRATFMILDTSNQTVWVRRIGYDAAAAFKKSRKAGLLPALSSMPAPVRPMLRWGAGRLGLFKARNYFRRNAP